MQTIQHRPDAQTEARWQSLKRHQLKYRLNGPAATFALSIVVFAVYMVLAQQMEGISFDTLFLCTYCTALSVFVSKAFMLAADHDS